MRSATQRNNPLLRPLSDLVGWSAGVLLCLILQVGPATAVPIEDDPNGFEGIPWGATLSERDHFVKVEDTGRTQTFERKDTPPMLGLTPVDTMRFMTFHNRFGRVTVRYNGKATHEAIIAHLQSTYGQLDRTPGQIAVGPVKVYAWHGFHTEITLRFEASIERGIIFFESRTLPERWADEGPSTVF